MAETRLEFVVESYPLPDYWTGRVFGDAFDGVTTAAEWYRYRFSEAELPAALAARRAQAWQADRGRVVEALRAQHQGWGSTPQIDVALARLAEPGTFAVVTGQQPGLFGGPLYTLYKALATIGLAARLTSEGTPTVPLFWVATEDDDFAEVKRCWVVDRDRQLASIDLDLPHQSGQSVGPLPLGQAWPAAVSRLGELLPESHWSAELTARLLELGDGATLGEVFARQLVDLLGHLGLVVVDPTVPALRQLALPLLDRVLDNPLAPTVLSNQVGMAIRAAGYHLPTHREADLCAFYLYRDGFRRRLRADGDGLVTDAGERLSVAGLRAELHDAPEHFSTSLLLRPVLQDYLFPTAGFIVGPGEIGYLAQVGPLYDRYEVARPLLLPRWSATVLEPKAAEVLATYGLSLDDLLGDVAALHSRVAKSELGQAATARFGAAWSQLEPVLDALRDYGREVDPNLGRTGEGLARQVRQRLERFESKVQRALRRQDQTIGQRLRVAQNLAAPGGGLQERRLGAVSYVGRWGGRLVDRLAEALSGSTGQHLILRLQR